jgi:UDP-N-acetylglucosamine:LPS N-acetylglucosamine transferase
MTGRRFLILSAGMGSGHDTVARELAARLEAAGHQAILADVLELLPARIGGGLRATYRRVIERVPVLYAGIYQVFFRGGRGGSGDGNGGARLRPGSAPLAVLAERRLLALAGRHQADVVVSVFHLAAQVAGRLRARGVLTVPSAVVMTEFEAHRQWLHPGNDLYLCHTEDIAAEISKETGCPAAGNGPLVGARFAECMPATSLTRADRWRRDLSPDGRPLVLLSTGAWGIGSSLARTARLLDRAGYAPAVLCGENKRLHRRLSALPEVRVLSWVEDMPGLMWAASALIDNAAGQTAMEALAAGLPVVGYRPIPGHGADGVRVMARLGLSNLARDEEELLSSLWALARPGPTRERRIATGRAVFRSGAISPLIDLGAREPTTKGMGQPR